MVRAPIKIWRLTLTGLVTTLVGAGILAGVLFAVGAIGGSASGARTPSDPPPTNAELAAPLNAAAMYAAADPSVVDVSAIDTDSEDTGTGFLIDSHGHVLTADHVVAGATSVSVEFADGTTVPAQVLGQDTSTDVAVLKVKPSPSSLPALNLGNTNSLVVGDTVAVIGNPFGYNRSLSTGVVSAIDRTIRAPNGWLIPYALQTDAAINPGNSGGPVLDGKGSVVGIVDQIATGESSVDSDTGVGFAVPIELAKSELAQLEHGVKVAHAYLGAALGQSDTSQPGALVQVVIAGSPAARSGLRPNDLITAIDGTVIRGPSAVVAAIATHRPGDKLTLQVQRGPSRLSVTATLAKQPSRFPAGL